MSTEPWVRSSWSNSDAHKLITMAGMCALIAAALMARLGLPPIDLHGPLHQIGIMDPLCGGTRAARFVALGQWQKAWQYNPLSIMVVGAAAAIMLRTLGGILTHRWLTFSFSWSAKRTRVATSVVLLLLIVLEIRQQGRASLLMAGT